MIECESCNKQMQGDQVSIFDKEIKPGIQARVWSCIHCEHKHIFLVTDKKARRMTEENRKDREKIGNINKRAAQLSKEIKLSKDQGYNNLVRVEKIQQRIDKRTTDLEKHTQELMDEYKETM